MYAVYTSPGYTITRQPCDCYCNHMDTAAMKHLQRQQEHNQLCTAAVLLQVMLLQAEHGLHMSQNESNMHAVPQAVCDNNPALKAGD